MPNSKPFFKQPRFLILGALLLVLVAAAFVGLMLAQASPAQSFPYNHSVHIKSGIQCIFCHSGAQRGVTAGLPTLQKCQGCHNNIDSSKATNPKAVEAWRTYAQNHTSVEWVPVAIQPDFVYFSHQPHIAAKINCEQCHGDVSQMTVAQPQRLQKMGWCLDCHKAMAPDKTAKLTDCATCHK